VLTPAIAPNGRRVEAPADAALAAIASRIDSARLRPPDTDTVHAYRDVIEAA